MRTTLITLAVLVLIGGGIFFFFSKGASFETLWNATPAEPLPTSYTDTVATAQKSESEDIATYNSALEKQDVTLCDSIDSTARKTDCQDTIQSAQAQSSDNLDGCTTLSDSGKTLQCQDNIYAARAQKNTDKTLCSKIDAKNLKSYCEEQVDTRSLQDALEKNTVSESFCSSLVESLQDECKSSLTQVDDTAIYTEAIKKKDLKLCDTLSNEDIQGSCRDAIILQMALAEQNGDYCASISDTEKKQYCESTLNKKNDAERFQDIVATGDIAQCNKFSDKTLQYQCSDMITLAQVRTTHDSNLCGDLFNTGMQYACVQIANANK